MSRRNGLVFEELREDLDGNVEFANLDYVAIEEETIEDVSEGFEFIAGSLDNLANSITDSTDALEDLYSLSDDLKLDKVELPDLSLAVESLMNAVGLDTPLPAFSNKTIAQESISKRIEIMWKAIVNAIRSAITWIKNWFTQLFRDRNIYKLKKEISTLIDKANDIDFETISKLTDPNSKSASPIVYPLGVQSLLTTSGDKYFDPSKVDSSLDQLIRFVVPSDESGMSLKSKLTGSSDNEQVISKLPFGNISIIVSKNADNKFRMKLGKDIDHNYVTSINDSKSTTRIKIDKSLYLNKLHNLDKLMNKIKEYNNHASRLSAKLSSKANDIERKYSKDANSAEVKQIRDEINYNIQILTSLYPKITNYTITVVRAYLVFLKANLR